MFGLAILVIFLGGTVYAASYVNKVSGPNWLNPGYQFYADSDTSLGESVCVEIHPTSPDQGYHRHECTYDSDQGGGVHRWECNTDTNYANNNIEYQFFVCDSETSCQTNCEAWTGFNWDFNTGPNAVTFTKLTGRTPILTLAAGLMFALGAIVAWRRK